MEGISMLKTRVVRVKTSLAGRRLVTVIIGYNCELAVGSPPAVCGDNVPRETIAVTFVSPVGEEEITMRWHSAKASTQSLVWSSDKADDSSNRIACLGSDGGRVDSRIPWKSKTNARNAAKRKAEMDIGPVTAP
jgi:hypothetical protein